MRAVRSVTLVLALALCGPQGADAQERRLGEIAFPNSGSGAAQSDFIEGVLLLHSFEFADAAQAFRRAQATDPDFGLAFWGEAMTYNHPLWREQDRNAALATLARFAPTPQARQEKAQTPREAAYLAAVDVLYGEGDKTTRDRAYMHAMERLAAAHPDDVEAAAFHSLAILGSTDGERDFSTYMKAAAVSLPIFDAHPQHPGAAHYIIHSFDDPVHAPLGLEAARAYSEIAPDAAHAQHMTSHIFVAMGLWDDLVAANVRARDVQNTGRARAGSGPNVCGHYTSWLHYGWLQRGEVQAAEQGMQECLDRVLAGGDPAEVNYFVNMRARHVIDLGDWEAAERLSASLSHPGYHFVNGYAAIRRGDVSAAQAALIRLAEVATDAQPRRQIEHMELAALLADHNGDAEGAIRLLEQAAALEETLPFEFGPPASLQPPHELLGAIYMQNERPADAARAFRRALEFTPRRTTSLLGLAAASDVLGDQAAARAALLELEGIWRNADPDFLQRLGIGSTGEGAAR